MFLHRFFTPGLAINSYLLADTVTRRAVLIDPTRDVETYINFAKANHYIITHIAETHVHTDFISGAQELKHRLQGEPIIHCSAMGGENFTPKYCDSPVYENGEIDLGVVRLQAVHTPGHTPEHLIWLCYDKKRCNEEPCLAFTGDFILVGSLGRPDLCGAELSEELEKKLYDSIHKVLNKMPDFMEIYPAHGAGSFCGKNISPRSSSTLGFEKKCNPLLKKEPFDIWLSKLKHEMPGIPVNFKRIKQLNLSGISKVGNQPENQQKKPFLIDVRMPEDFSEGHLKDSINIPLVENFLTWMNSVLGEEIPLGIIIGATDQLLEIVQRVQLIGFDHIVRHIVWDENRLKDEFEIEKIPLISVDELTRYIDTHIKHFILDVRTPNEWLEGHISNSTHIELVHIHEKIETLPKDIPIFVICSTGYRASIVASLLKKHGFKKVSNVKGGVKAWLKAKLPLQKKNNHKD